MKTDYYPTNQERDKMAFCIRLGYRCYPVVMAPNFYKIVGRYRSYPPKDSIEEPFEKKFLTYYVIEFYKKIWNAINQKK